MTCMPLRSSHIGQFTKVNKKCAHRHQHRQGMTGTTQLILTAVPKVNIQVVKYYQVKHYPFRISGDDSAS